MAAKFADLVSYFEDLAARHTDIRHTAKSKHFFRFELDEVLGALCNNIQFPALILESYDFNYRDSGSDNIMKNRTGAFILLGKVKDTGDYNKIHEVWDQMEELGEDLLIKMREDKASRKVAVLRDFDISESEGIPFGVKQMGQYGVRFTFQLRSAVNSNINTDKWLTNL